MGLAAPVLSVEPVERISLELVPRRSEGVKFSRSALYFGLLLGIFQILDGVLTTLGVTRYGIAMEGNPLLRQLMDLLGCMPALALAKLFALGVITFLVLSARSIRWVNGALGAVAAIYLFAAIIPWTYILFFVEA